jgi:hypothetical protein
MTAKKTVNVQGTDFNAKIASLFGLCHHKNLFSLILGEELNKF